MISRLFGHINNYTSSTRGVFFYILGGVWDGFPPLITTIQQSVLYACIKGCFLWSFLKVYNKSNSAHLKIAVHYETLRFRLFWRSLVLVMIARKVTDHFVTVQISSSYLRQKNNSSMHCVIDLTTYQYTK